MNKMDLSKVPIFNIPAEQIPNHVKPVSEGGELKFDINLKGFVNVVLEPFYKIHFERYAIYWPTATATSNN